MGARFLSARSPTPRPPFPLTGPRRAPARPSPDTTRRAKLCRVKLRQALQRCKITPRGGARPSHLMAETIGAEPAWQAGPQVRPHASPRKASRKVLGTAWARPSYVEAPRESPWMVREPSSAQGQGLRVPDVSEVSPSGTSAEEEQKH